MKLSAIVVAFLLPFPFSNAVAQSVNDAQIASIVVTIFARIDGCRNGAPSTSVPKRIRSVIDASPAIAVSGSIDAIGAGSSPYRPKE